MTKRKASDATSPAFDTAVAVAAEEVSPAKRIKAQPDFTDTKVVAPYFACLRDAVHACVCRDHAGAP